MKRLKKFEMTDILRSGNDKSSGNLATGRWAKYEHLTFIKGILTNNFIALQKYGKKWKLIQKEIPGRSAPQIRTHAQKFFIKLSCIKPENLDVITYIKETPASTLLNIPSQNNPNGFDNSSSDILPNPIPIESEPLIAEKQ
eukprot:TRINITY_DN2837_c0_g2_i1.p2 TRINITY_DN2837_c0_g2~~TRINITY_DN2837_c0_g2_i1.p2  ORF type:complete len:141 (-),score=18.69 TRINITY_DN2837_c0_g2_i1:168-590(-)